MKYFIALIIFIVVIYLGFPKAQAQENFTNKVQEETNFYDINSPPVTIHANNVQQLYKDQRIYPYSGVNPYEVGDFPNVTMTPHVVSCGGRRGPCYGGSQQVVNNVIPPLNISNNNIAPNNVLNNQKEKWHPIGVAYKVFGSNNNELKLFLKESKGTYHYAVLLNGSLTPILHPHFPYRQLGTNDVIKIPKMEGNYRVSVYDTQYPNYLPMAFAKKI
jgi:hypothetical protein